MVFIARTINLLRFNIKLIKRLIDIGFGRLLVTIVVFWFLQRERLVVYQLNNDFLDNYCVGN